MPTMAVTMQLSNPSIEKNWRLAMTSLIGAGTFGLVAHPMMCLAPERSIRCARPALDEDDGSRGCRIAQATTATGAPIAHPHRKLEDADLGGGVQ
jgi:hypothetical protein